METNQKVHTYKARSEEVQQILSRPPVWIVRWGSGIAFSFLLVLIGIAWLIPSPTVIQASLKITHRSFVVPLDSTVNDSSFVAAAKLRQENFSKIRIGQKVVIKLNAYNERDFGVLHGKVVWLSEKFEEQPGYFDVVISLPQQHKTSRDYKVQYIPGMLGHADIIVSEQRLIQKLSPF